MPRLDGIEATAAHRRGNCRPRASLVLTTFDLDEYAFGALAAGASGFLLKDARRGELVGGRSAPSSAATRCSHRGSRASSIRRLDCAAAGPRHPTLTAPLTERERDVFVAMARGRNNTEIARALFLSESTVKTHVGRVLAKLGARDRVRR